ncbi:MAG: glycoside hydrolase family 65 protein [Candidatus Longimicrobiales bacterium M2_2A_002]
MSVRMQETPPRAGPGEPEAWVLAYDGFNREEESLREALCALGNGHWVTRGAAEEARADEVHYPGTYVAGGYNRLASEVAGRTVVNEDLVNVPNWLPLTFRPEEGEWLNLGEVEVLSYRQELNLRDGLLMRRFRIRDAAGRRTRLESRRIVSMAYPHLGSIDYRVTPENWAGGIRFRSSIDGSVRNVGVARYRQLASRHLETVDRGPVAPEGVYLVARNVQSRFEVGQAARTRVYADGERARAERRILDDEADAIGEEIKLEVTEGATIRVEKTVALFSSHDRGIGEPGIEARHAVREADGFDRLLASHRHAWEALWRRYDIEIGDEQSAELLAREQLTLRLHIFHLLQTVSPHTVGLDVGAPARGLHGEAYRGHIFWDELFVLPFYTMRQPDITRSLLLYRYYRLDSARQLAREAGYEGAMYPWQSSHDGREATQELHLNPRSGEWGPDWSHLQRHVNAAIAYNVWCYWRGTGDLEFLRAHGAEMILEIARFWASLATWTEERERYEIVGVMGPDEYHEKYPGSEAGGLRNNAYTNVMAAWCLRRALDVLDEVGSFYRGELLAQLAIRQEDLDRWHEIAGGLFVPFVDDGILEQFEGYAELKPFDWDGYRERYGNIERLDRILKAEDDTPDRYQVSKQADATMLFYLFEVDELQPLLEGMGYSFDRETLERTVDYYRGRTSHGSTLSKTVFASVVHHLDCEEGCRLFLEAVRSDIDDVQGGSTPEGIHLGAMAGTVGIVLTRYVGARLRPEGVLFEPEMPPRLRRVRCSIHWRGRWLDVELSRASLRVTADSDRPEPVSIRIDGAWRDLQPGETLDVAV